jgi:hypothetical protein
MLLTIKNEVEGINLSNGIVVMSEQDKAFLAQLVLFARQYGWNGDYVEVCQFVRWAHESLNAAVPTPIELDPLDF